MMERRVIPIRASSFGTLLDCAARWEGEQLLKMRKPSSLRAWMGTSIHAGTAAFDQAKIDGAPITPSVAADVMMDTFESHDDDVDLRDDKLSVKEAQRISLSLLSRYCAEVSPLFEFTSVEMPLKPLDIDCGDGLTIQLTGTMDRARAARTNAGEVVVDLKSGGRLFQDGRVIVKGRAAQVGTYQILKEATDGTHTIGAQIAALQTSAAPLVGVSNVFNAKGLLLGNDSAPGLLEIAAKMFKAGLFPPNPSSPLCNSKYCVRWNSCPYHE